MPALALDELPQEGLKVIEIQGQAILIGRFGGRLVAWLDRCPHAGAPLRLGKRRGEELTCARHGWIFNLLTGKAVPDDPTCQLSPIPLKVEGLKLLVSL